MLYRLVEIANYFCTMSPIPLTFASGLYDRMVPLATGEVRPTGIDINFLDVHHPRDVSRGYELRPLRQLLSSLRRYSIAWHPVREGRVQPSRM